MDKVCLQDIKCKKPQTKNQTKILYVKINKKSREKFNIISDEKMMTWYIAIKNTDKYSKG